VDVDTKVLLTTNQSLPLADGYTLALSGASEHGDEAHLVLLKNGAPVYTAVTGNNEDFVFKVGG